MTTLTILNLNIVINELAAALVEVSVRGMSTMTCANSFYGKLEIKPADSNAGTDPLAASLSLFNHPSKGGKIKASSHFFPGTTFSFVSHRIYASFFGNASERKSTGAVWRVCLQEK